MSEMWSRAALAFGIAAAGCYSPSAATGVPCAANGACPSGQSCDYGHTPAVCVTGVVVDDAHAQPDAPHFDAPVATDARVHDAPPDTPAITATLVQQVAGGLSTGTPLTVTLSSPPGVGHVLIAVTGARQAALAGVSGGGVATWTRAAHSMVNCNEEIWFGTVSSSSTSAVSIAIANNTHAMFLSVSEWKGLSETLDTANAMSGSASPATAGSITAHGPDLVVFAASDAAPVTFGTPTPGTWTALTPAAGDPCHQSAWYREVSVASGVDPSVAENASEVWDSAIAAFSIGP